ncbi:unnamed protein product [Rotaria sp. Silwood1]|nr:unnamed protein product [Rotaria sp. Silwood1]
MGTAERLWLHGVINAFIVSGAAATVFGGTVCVYDSEGVRQVAIGNDELLVELQEGFTVKMDRVELKIHIDCNLSRKGILNDGT